MPHWLRLVIGGAASRAPTFQSKKGGPTGTVGLFACGWGHPRSQAISRAGAAYLGFCALGYGAGVFLCEGWMLTTRYELYAVGVLLIAGAAALLPGLFQFYRIIKLDLALRRMKLPYKLGVEGNLPAEAEEIESKHGWDEGNPKK